MRDRETPEAGDASRDLLDGYFNSIITNDWNDDVLENICEKNFKHDDVLKSFNALSEISFNFPENSTDHKAFQVNLFKNI